MKKLFFTVVLLLSLLVGLIGCGKVKEPTVKEGKFNFSITYEAGGEEKTISSVFVCKFVEAGKTYDGYYVTWDSYVEDSEIENSYPEFNYGCIVVETNEDGTIYLDLTLHAEYFMSEPGYDGMRDFKPYVFIKYNDAVAEEKGYGNEDPEVLETYGVKIISYQCDDPIVNEYK